MFDLDAFARPFYIYAPRWLIDFSSVQTDLNDTQKYPHSCTKERADHALLWSAELSAHTHKHWQHEYRMHQSDPSVSHVENSFDCTCLVEWQSVHVEQSCLTRRRKVLMECFSLCRALDQRHPLGNKARRQQLRWVFKAWKEYENVSFVPLRRFLCAVWWLVKATWFYGFLHLSVLSLQNNL